MRHSMIVVNCFSMLHRLKPCQTSVQYPLGFSISHQVILPPLLKPHSFERARCRRSSPSCHLGIRPRQQARRALTRSGAGQISSEHPSIDYPTALAAKRFGQRLWTRRATRRRESCDHFAVRIDFTYDVPIVYCSWVML